jgi:hypothetical protein
MASVTDKDGVIVLAQLGCGYWGPSFPVARKLDVLGSGMALRSRYLTIRVRSPQKRATDRGTSRVRPKRAMAGVMWYMNSGVMPPGPQRRPAGRR